jgi:hypothetical protein
MNVRLSFSSPRRGRIEGAVIAQQEKHERSAHLPTIAPMTVALVGRWRERVFGLPYPSSSPLGTFLGPGKRGLRP